MVKSEFMDPQKIQGVLAKFNTLKRAKELFFAKTKLVAVQCQPQFFKNIFPA